MKAWVVWWADECCTLIHANTRGKAKIFGQEIMGSDSYLEMRALRKPGLDDLPITYENAKEAGFEYSLDTFGGGLLPPEEFINDCPCDICKGARR